MAVFDPSEDQRAFRNALGQFPTGVTVITTQDDQVPFGVTANSFASVSLDPPLVMWCQGKSSQRHDVFVKAKYFAVHILADDQRDIANAFAKTPFGFTGLDFTLNPHDTPIIKACVAVFECEAWSIYDAGDHSIIIGHVFRVLYNTEPPLVFAKGAYRMLASS